jgi:adenylate cyclase
MSADTPVPGRAEGRRLAAVVFTDVEGYSTRMQRDEVATMALVMADFARMSDLCAQHGGEVLNSMGDGLLLCFPSVVEAVGCSLQIQAEFAHRRTVRAEDQALVHRIGIHLGDVFRDRGQVAGDGVNIAARLQTKAQPGTICVSKNVYDLVKGKLPMQAEPLGLQQFKNISESIAVYLLAPSGGTMPPFPGPAPRKSTRRWVAGALCVVAAVLGAVFWPKSRPAAAPAVASAPVPVPVSAKSVAVLPFVNMSENKDNAFFADGVQEDILTGLALIGDMNVISRTSVMGYRDTTKPIQQIGRELGVAFVLEGSVRRVGNEVRVTGQLIDARSGLHVWARSYDRNLDDIFAIQAALAKEIASALHAALTPHDLARLQNRPTESTEAYDLFLQGRASLHSGDTKPVALARAQKLFEQAVALDPKFASAWVELANVHLEHLEYLDASAGRVAKAREAIDTALRLAPDSLDALAVMGRFLLKIADYDGANAVIKRMVDAYPNNPATLTLLAGEAQFGDRKRALSYYLRAQLSDPRNPDLLSTIGLFYFNGRRFDEAAAEMAAADVLQPPSILRSYRLAFIPYLARGETGPMKAFQETLTPEQLKTDRNAICAAAQWAYTIGDAAGLVRLWEKSGANWAFAPETGRMDLIAVAQAFIILGQPSRARPLLEENGDKLAGQLAHEPANYEKWKDLEYVTMLLGNRAATDDADLRARKACPGVEYFRDARFLMWRGDRGDKDKAIEVLAKDIPDGGGDPWETNVHLIAHQIAQWPVQGDPRFEALLKDPANNAPEF